MSSHARKVSSRSDGARSRGPVSAEGKFRSSQNAVIVHGLRAAPGLVLPGESQDELAALHERWVNELRPRTEGELDLVTDLVHARWLLIRAQRADYTHSKTLIVQAGAREQSHVEKCMAKLLWDRRGPLCMYGLSSCNDGEPGTSWQDSADDPHDPAALVRELEGSAKGCEALIRNWRSIAERVQNDLPVQAHDRLTAIRMLGRQPVDCGRDERVNLIFLASFALHPIGRVDAYEDLKSDMGTIELEKFKDGIRNRGPLLVSASDTPRAKQMLLDLVDRVVQRLTAKIEVYQQLASEDEAEMSASLAHDRTPDGERMRRYEQAAQRRVHRCEDAFWKHRREREQMESQEAEVLDEEMTDSSDELGVVEEATNAPKTNLPSEPKVAISASEVGTEKEVAALDKKLDWASAALAAMRAGGIDPFAPRAAGGGAGQAAIEASVNARGPLLRPIS